MKSLQMDDCIRNVVSTISYGCLSSDDGATWDAAGERIVQAAPNNDLGYPAAVQLSDGSIITVYYQVDEVGEKTCLMGTRWRV